MSEAASALALAASSGDISAVDAHLANGGSVELRDASGATLLVVAAQAGQAVVLERLLAAHADTSACNARGDTALH